MATHGRKEIDEALLAALACGATNDAAAQKVGVDKRTVYRRLKDPEFRLRLQTLRTEMVQRSADMLTAAAMEAIKTLLSLQQESVPAATRLGAARAVLEIGMKLREASELEQRLAAVEDHLRQREGVPS